MIKYDIRKSMTKKAYKEIQKKKRVDFTGAKMGTISMKSKKDYNRREDKKNLKKMLDNSNY